MEILILRSLSRQDIEDLLELMKVLDDAVPVTPEMLHLAASDPSSHLFAAIEDGHILGCATLCITRHPLGLKGGIEDVVVSPAARGRHIGRQLMEAIIAFSRELAPIELHLTSRPARIEANYLYQAVGFQKYDTNVYKLKL